MPMRTASESKPMRLSRRARVALKLDNAEPIYKIAQRAALNPSLISQWLRGILSIRRDDPRIARLAAALGMTVAAVVEPMGTPAASEKPPPRNPPASPPSDAAA